jgi:hypothetical protein
MERRGAELREGRDREDLEVRARVTSEIAPHMTIETTPRYEMTAPWHGRRRGTAR